MDAKRINVIIIVAAIILLLAIVMLNVKDRSILNQEGVKYDAVENNIIRI